jgi:hypothetical protein
MDIYLNIFINSTFFPLQPLSVSATYDFLLTSIEPTTDGVK